MLALAMHVFVMLVILMHVWFDGLNIVCIALKKIICKDTLHTFMVEKM